MRASLIGMTIGIAATSTITLAACASRDANPSKASSPLLSPQTSLPAAKYLGPIRQPIAYAKAGISLKPPGAVNPAASWADAYDNCRTGDAVCDTNSPPNIALALATAEQAGEAAPDGSIVPLMKDTLVYVLTWIGIPCVPKSGPPPAPDISDSTSASATYSCTLLNFIDASSGKVLYSTEGPNP